MMGIELDCQFCQGVTTVYSEDGSSYSITEPSMQEGSTESLPFESNTDSDSTIEPLNNSEVEGVIIPQAPSLNEPGNRNAATD